MTTVPMNQRRRPLAALRQRAIIAITVAVFLVATVLTVYFWPRSTKAVVEQRVAIPVSLTPVQNAKEKGAVCLDGSTPQYHLDLGSGAGADSWLLHLEGGAWCGTVESCLERSRTWLGSSLYMEPQDFYGILSPVPSENPDFYNWNRVMVRYCDGASFSGDVEGEIEKNGTKLFFRGQRIWEAVMSDLMSKGLADAKKEGYFRKKDHALYLRGDSPSSECGEKLTKEVQNVLAPSSSDTQQHWTRCKFNIKNCDAGQVQFLQGFRTSMLNSLKVFQNNKQEGMFIDSCFEHCQTLGENVWHSPESPRINKMTIAEAVGDWFFDKREVMEIDCAIPCNSSCSTAMLADI